jgi:hypothetical protein
MLCTGMVLTVAEARRRGLTWEQLQGPRWRRIGPGQYTATDVRDSILLKLQAVAIRLPPGAAFAGRTAAWLHGLDIQPLNPIEVAAAPSLGGSHSAPACWCDEWRWTWTS